ncbi:MAG: transposase [Deltaproteobacteria bacterium]|nr:transposase [Deltaproteobacteria bacterium]
MARALRIQYPGAYYHVTCRGNERRDIYQDREDKKIFKSKLKVSQEIYSVEVLGYVLMSNHFHLLIHTPQGNLSEFMRHFNISYTSAYNRRHKRCGHLYQGRYKAFLIDAENYLLTVSRYIHLNPIRTDKCAGHAPEAQWAELQKYVDSSLAGYCRESEKEEFVDYRRVLGFVGGDNRKGRQNYKNFMRDEIRAGAESPLLIGCGSGIIGEYEFVEWVKEKVLRDTRDNREQPALKQFRKNLRPQAVIEEFVQITGKRTEELCQRGRSIAERALLMEVLYRCCDITQPDIGRLVGGVDYSAVSQARKRLREKMANDKNLKWKYDKIIEQLMGMSG